MRKLRRQNVNNHTKTAHKNSLIYSINLNNFWLIIREKELTATDWCLWAVEWVMDWAAISPNPQIKPELMTWVLTGCIAKQFWYHFHSFNISSDPIIFNFINDLQREGGREKFFLGFNGVLDYWRMVEYSCIFLYN